MLLPIFHHVLIHLSLLLLLHSSSLNPYVSSLASPSSPSSSSSPSLSSSRSTTTTSLSSTTSPNGTSSQSDGSKNQQQRANPKVIPITVLSGFLGAGKTSLLRHLLTNNGGLKIAVVVNDVADVNIDSKLISAAAAGASSASASGRPAGIVQLQNGCACCSLSDELLPSISELVTLSDLRRRGGGADADEEEEEEDDGGGGGFDHIVIELSGVADPRSIRANFQNAVMYDMPLMERVKLDTMVTVVDCGAFLECLTSGKGATPKDAPELFYRNPDEAQLEQNDDWLDSLPEKLREALAAGDEAYSSFSSTPQPGGVADLLVEQTEVADIVLLNKIDTQSPEKINEIEYIVKALNPRASIIRTQYGKVDTLKDILGAARGLGVAECGVVDDHKDAVAAATAETAAAVLERTDEEACTDPNCNDPSHSHSHTHEHEHNHSSSEMTASGGDVGKEVCNDPNCSDPSHSHSHTHEHTHDSLSTLSSKKTSYDGIGTFVYRARKPFHPRRLVSFLRHLPVVRGLPPSDAGEGKDDDERTSSNIETAYGEEGKCIRLSANEKTTLKSVLRSKGFTWMADSNVAATYWSHAGGSFEMQCLGRWWATLPRDQWPEEARDAILADFDDRDHDEDKYVSTGSASSCVTVGDRRQEIVFIGTGMGDPKRQDDICNTLNSCLLTETEWKVFRSKINDERDLKETFINPIQSRMISY